MSARRSSRAQAEAVQRQLRILRQARPMKQADLAARLGLSDSGLGHIERGLSPISLERFLAVCRLLRVSPAALLEETDPMHAPATGLAPFLNQQAIAAARLADRLRTRALAQPERSPARLHLMRAAEQQAGLAAELREDLFSLSGGPESGLPPAPAGAQQREEL